MTVGLTLLVANVLMHAPGALLAGASRWNLEVGVDQHPEAVWDWSRPQSMAGVGGAPRRGK